MIKTLVPFMIFLLGCFGRPVMMTQERFDDIVLGTPIAEVSAKVGEPYNICSIGKDTEEYEYIEKINLDTEAVVENHYFLIVTNGQVMGKRTSQERPPAYDLIYEEDPNHNY